MKRILLLSLMAGWVLVACQKKVDDPEPNPNPPGPTPPTAEQKLKDSVMLYTRDIYLWYNQIPATFNAQSYSDPNKIMEAIRPFSREAGFSNPVDRWSFAVKKVDWDNASSGISADLGMGIFFRSNNDLRVTYVEKDGAAGKAGVQRSWRLIKINGNSSINTSDASINFIVNAIYGGNAATVEFQKPDGSTQEITLTPITYQEYPLALDTVYTNGGKKIGYVVLNSFLGDQDQIKAAMASTFSDFGAQGVSELIVDLRYNGGGFVSLWEEMGNYLAPTAANGKVMYRQSFNNRYASQFDETVNFEKKGTVNPAKIVFIISQNTASASEGLINSLTPHTEVKIVGPSASNGKPVGYFPIPVGDWYILPVSFRTVNSNNQGSYFNGFIPESQVPDGLDKAWGDLTEDCLASAMKYLTTGSFRAATRESSRLTADYLESYQRLPMKKMKVLVEDRYNLSEKLKN
ncbi:MAG: S41 family peptidase [Flavihumibacter sp.]|nr:S41 family peptidase [Flavihumibacter sp.]